jgi:hypothetical protein
VLQRHHEVQQPIGIDPPLANILLELPDIIHSQPITNAAFSCSASFTEWTATKKTVTSSESHQRYDLMTQPSGTWWLRKGKSPARPEGRAELVAFSSYMAAEH